MAEDLGALVAKLQADVSDLKKGLKESRDDLRSFKDMAAEAGAQVKKALSFVGVAVGIYEIATALKEFAQDAAMVGARTETLAVGLEHVGKNAGLSKGTLDYYVEQLKKLGITTQEAMNAVTRFAVSGLPLDKIEQLADVARNQAALVGKNTSEAFNDILTGITTQQPEILRKYLLNIGLLSNVLKSAMKPGMTADDIDPLTRSMMVLNATLNVGQKSAGAYEAMMQTVGKQMTSLARFAEEAKGALWALFEPVMIAGVQEMARDWKDLKTWADANQESLKRWGQEGAAWLKWLVTGIRDIGAFIAENKNLIKTLLELYVASKAAGWFTAMGSELKKTAVEVGILAALLGKLKVLVGGPWKIAITVALYGLYEAWNAIQRLRQQAGFTPQAGAMSGAIQEGRGRDRARGDKELDIAGSQAAEEARRRGITLDAYLQFQKADQNRYAEAYRPGRKLTIPSTMPPVLSENETPEERRAREVKEAHEKALAESKSGAGGKGKGGAGKEDNLLAPMLAMFKVKREAELQDAQNSLDLLKTTNDKKRSELEMSLAEGLIDGQTYYQRLQDYQQQETTASLAMIEQKKAAQQKAYEESLTQLDADGKLSDEAKSIARQKLEIENRKALAKLDTEAARARLEGEKQVTDELRRQVEVRKQYQQKTEDLNLETQQLLGTITEQEAKLQQLTLDWQRTKDEAIRAGGYTPTYAQALDANLQAKKFDVNYGQTLNNIGNEFSTGMANIVSGIRKGTLDITTVLTTMFDNIMMATLKPGFDALGQAMTSLIKSLLSGLSVAMGGGVLFPTQTYGSSNANYTSPGYAPGGYGYQNYSAHGSAWYRGIRQAFATGGIVTRPTVFAMANGAGLMGEEGEEGILPLTRVSGDLGVKALFPQSGPPVVNIINKTGAEAQGTAMQQDDGTLDVILEKKVVGFAQRGPLYQLIKAISRG